MRVFYGIDDLQDLNRPIVTLGTFDGVHLGHRKILQRLIDKASQHQTHSLVITFNPHPRQVLTGDSSTAIFLNTVEEKIELLADAGVSSLLIIPFTREFASMEAEDFVTEFFVKALEVRGIVSGYDHKFGRKGRGNFHLLQKMSEEYGFETEEIPEYDIEAAKVSSTSTREALGKGDVAMAGRLLGYHYFMSGRVVRGMQLGSSLGFPTANITAPDPLKIIPSHGVYSVRAKTYLKEYPGMMNIGVKPTFGTNDVSLEVHLFDCKENLYGQDIKVSFIDYIRKERRFESAEALKAQLERDSEVAKMQLEKSAIKNTSK